LTALLTNIDAMELFGACAIVLVLGRRYLSLQEGSYLHTEIHTGSGSKELKDKAQRILKDLDYTLPAYCVLEYHGQLQTFTQFVTRNLTRLCRSYLLPSYSIRYRRELLRLPDGGTVALDWARKGNNLENPDLFANAPVVVLYHGLVGDSQSEYIYHLAWTLLSAGYRVVVMVARGCGGLELTNGEIFAGRRTADVACAVDRVKQLYPDAKVFWVGFSLGAALTLQYLAVPHANTKQPSAMEEGNCAQWSGPLTAAVAVSPPWAMNASSSLVTYLWLCLIVAPLKAHYFGHRSYLNKVAPDGVGGVSLWKVLTCMSMADFDKLMYSTHMKQDGGKYASVRDYYDDISPVHGADLIQTPTMVLTAKDDPVCMHQGAPTDPAKIGSGLVVVS